MSDTMNKLMSIKPLPRGERMARYMATDRDVHVECRRLWHTIMSESPVLSALFDAWIDEDEEDLRSKWNAYATPVRVLREKAHHLHECWGLSMNLLVDEAKKKNELVRELEDARRALNATR